MKPCDLGDLSKMLRLCILAGLVAAAHTGAYGFGATVPSQQIFAEKAPEPSEFKNYTLNEYQFAYSQGPIGLGFELPGLPPFTTSAESTYWHGKATTVANDWYDVKARRGVRAWR